MCAGICGEIAGEKVGGQVDEHGEKKEKEGRLVGSGGGCDRAPVTEGKESGWGGGWRCVWRQSSEPAADVGGQTETKGFRGRPFAPCAVLKQNGQR